MKSFLLLLCVLLLAENAAAQAANKGGAPATPPKTAPAQAAPAITTPAQNPAAQKAPAPTPTPAAPPKPALPNPPENVIFRPTFLTPDIAHYTGMAFRLKHEGSGQHFLVTCHSLFSKSAGLDVDMSSEDIAKVVVGAVGVSCTDRNKLVLAQPYILLKGARIADGKGAEKDMAIFRMAAQPDDPAFTLDPAPPFVGDKVWIYVKYQGTPTVGLEPATIAWVSETEIRYLLDNQTADLRNTSGAPIISLEGTVVGIHLGTFKSKSGRVFAFACPASAIRGVIEPPVKRGKTLQ